MSTNTKEIGFEEHFTNYLTDTTYGNGYSLRHRTDFDKEYLVDQELLFQFLEATQPNAVAALDKSTGGDYKRTLLKEINRSLSQIRFARGMAIGGIINLLRKELVVNNIKFRLFYDKPNQTLNRALVDLYQQNVFSVMRQVPYSKLNNNTLDMVVFINGLPIISFELKNEFTNQTVKDAIKQYKQDRDPKEPLFKLGRMLVHFAVDTELVYMTTHLKGESSYFLPFNKGNNNGAGNPENGGIKVDYLWKDILRKDTLTEIIQNYVQLFEEEGEKINKDGTFEKTKSQKLIFPRFHQLDAVRELLINAKENGTGQKYLIQHSAGSGKSNSISWLAHQLASLYNTDNQNVFDSIIIVTDRKILDSQIQKNVLQFEKTKGLVEPITDGSRQLKEALKDGKKIIISTIQKFPVIAAEMGELATNNFAIIIDEAHSSTSGNTLRKLNEALYKELTEETDEEEQTVEDDNAESNDALLQIIAKSRKLLHNASYFAFTATPKNKTLQLFGKPYEVGDQTKYEAFHLYSMKQAIEERFIEDVLKSYTTYNSFYSLYKKAEDDPKFDKQRAQKKLKQFVESHPASIEKKTKIIINHFIENVIHQRKINGLAKAMVVTSSRKNAVFYKHAFDKYLADRNLPFKSIVAFSGDIDGETEASLNHFSSSLIADEFKKPEFRFLIVASKFQTGFDQPLLHSMYVDKKLGGVNAVQTLSRLNRTTAGKEDTFVLDFANTVEEIENSFKPFYETTILADKTDHHKLFDLQTILDTYQIYEQEDVYAFTSAIIKNKPLDTVHGLLNKAVKEFNEVLSEEEQEDFRVKCKSFVRLYVFLSQIVPFESGYLESLYVYLNHLQNKIQRPVGEDLSKGVLDSIDMDSVKYRLLQTDRIYLQQGDELKPIPTEVKGGVAEPELEYLSEIVSEFNTRFGTEFTNEDKVRKLADELVKDVAQDQAFRDAYSYSDEQNAKITFDTILQQKLMEHIDSNFEVFKEYNDNPEFRKFFTNTMFSILQKDFSSFGNRTNL